MSECKIRARVGDKSIEKNVCRPDFEEVYRPYKTITQDCNNQYESKGEWAAAEYIFGKIGGQLLKEFQVAKKIKNKNYVNTCASRISWALNHNSSRITINTFRIGVTRIINHNGQPQTVSRGYKGVDGLTYYIGVDDIIDMLKLNWKKLDCNETNKCGYERIRDFIHNGQSKDFAHTMDTKNANNAFFKDFSGKEAVFGTNKLLHKKRGIIAMKGINLITKAGFGHTTLWDKIDFVDAILQTNENFLTNDNYLVKEVYYWDLG